MITESMDDAPDATTERLVPLSTWVHEKTSIRAISRSGGPHLIGPDDMGKWLKRHEARLIERGTGLRLGNAWRIVEPGFRSVSFEILAEEREQAARKTARKEA